MLVCVVDTQPQLPPEAAELRVDAQQAGLRGEITDEADAAEATREGEMLTLRVRADPAAVVVVK
jgi:hypothetical protein